MEKRKTKGILGRIFSPELNQPDLSSRAVRTALVKSAEFSGESALAAAVRLWNILLLSLPFYMAAAWLLRGSIPPVADAQHLNYLLAILLALSLLALQGEKLVDALLAIQPLVMRATSSRLGSLIFAALTIAAVALEGIVRLGELSPVALIVAGLICVTAIPPVLKFFAEQRFRHAAIQKDLLQLVLINNKLIFFLRIYPLVTTSLLALCLAAQYAMHASDERVFVASLAGCVVLMFVFRPERKDFLTQCRKCSLMAPLALKSAKCCPACSPEAF